MQWPDPSIELFPHIAVRVSKGYGCGIGASYKPWESLRNRGGHGTSRGFLCAITGRMVDLPSGAHQTYYLLQERRNIATSIETGFPFLDLSVSLRVCARLGIEHPASQRKPRPFLLDFLVRENSDGGVRLRAATLSRARLDGDETSELDVIAALCRHYQIDWKVVDPTALDATLLHSLLFARRWTIDRFKPRPGGAAIFAHAFLQVHRPANTLKESLEASAAKLGVTLAIATRMFRHAAWVGALQIDFTRALRLDAPVRILQRTA